MSLFRETTIPAIVTAGCLSIFLVGSIGYIASRLGLEAPSLGEIQPKDWLSSGNPVLFKELKNPI